MTNNEKLRQAKKNKIKTKQVTLFLECEERNRYCEEPKRYSLCSRMQFTKFTTLLQLPSNVRSEKSHENKRNGVFRLRERTKRSESEKLRSFFQFSFVAHLQLLQMLLSLLVFEEMVSFVRRKMEFRSEEANG